MSPSYLTRTHEHSLPHTYTHTRSNMPILFGVLIVQACIALRDANVTVSHTF
jgi:hypothetical protein